jgi:ligand-binding SRPBCC domain-containing protein
MPLIHLETVIEAPAERCFDLNRDVEAHLASTAGSSERVVEGRTHGLFELAETVTWEAVHLGLRRRLTSKITACDRPTFFEDVMVRGPFRSITHQHRFVESEQRTLMIDDFAYQAPLGVLGKLADRLFLKRYMERLLEKRAQTLKTLAEKKESPLDLGLNPACTPGP